MGAGSSDDPNGMEFGLGHGTTSRGAFIRRAGAAGIALSSLGSLGKGLTSTAWAAEKPRLAFAHPDRGAIVVQAITKAAQDEAAKKGWTVLQSYAYGNAAKQADEANTWIGQGVAAIVVLPLEAHAWGPVIKRAHARNIPVIGYGLSVAGSDGTIGWANLRAGRTVGTDAGKWINEKLGGKAEVALMAADNQAIGRARIGGAVEALKKVAPNAKIVARVPAVLAADALAKTRAVLQAHPNLNVVLCIADDGCIGARSAMKAAGRPADETYIAGWDGSKPALELLKKPNEPIRSIASLPLALLGRSVVDVAWNAVNHKKPTSVVLPYTFVTKSDRSAIDKLLSAYP